MRRALLAQQIAALAACAPSASAPLPAREPPTETYVVLRVSDTADQAVLSAHVHSRDDVARRLTLARRPGEILRVLEYTQTARELELVVDAEDKALEILPAGTPTDVAWPLLAPRATLELRKDGFEETMAAEAWRAGLRVRRPPCPPPPVVTPVGPLPAPGHVSFATRWGEELLFGLAPDVARGFHGSVYRMPLDGTTPVSVPAFEVAPDPRLPGPPLVGFVEGDRAWIHWVDPARRDHQLAVIDRSGAIVERYDARLGFDKHLQSIHGIRDGERMVILGQYTHHKPADRADAHLALLELDALAWRSIHTATISQTEGCDHPASYTLVELEPGGTGWVGLFGGPIVRFDVEAPGMLLRGVRLYGEGPMCRNARARLPGGAEVLVFERGDKVGDQRPGAAWRLQDGDWFLLEGETSVSGDAIAVAGDWVVASGREKLIAAYQYVPSRPEIAPRQCHEIATGIEVRHLVALGRDRVFAGGHEGVRAAVLDFAVAPP